MMKHYCITGGIGSGKSYVCTMMRHHGIVVYDCDSAAKRLMVTSSEIRERLTALIGKDAYMPDGRLNKPVIVGFLLASEANKKAINAIVHPVVMRDFLDSGIQWMECAILYEAHLEKFADLVVAVTAPHEVRVKRIMQRDGISMDMAEEWINKQVPQEIVQSRADYVIENDGIKPLAPQIDFVLEKISEY